MKLLLWLVLGLVVFYILRNKKKKSSSYKPRPDAASAASANAETMLRCVECGIYLPASEALHDPTGAAFCSDEHRRRHAVH
jgi:uncharacterized protein